MYAFVIFVPRCFDLGLRQAHFGCARDRLHQDNIIKLIDKGTMEEQIYQYLADCEALYDGDAFPCVLPPTAVIASPYKFTFIATPM